MFKAYKVEREIALVKYKKELLIRKKKDKNPENGGHWMSQIVRIVAQKYEEEEEDKTKQSVMFHLSPVTDANRQRPFSCHLPHYTVCTMYQNNPKQI